MWAAILYKLDCVESWASRRISEVNSSMLPWFKKTSSHRWHIAKLLSTSGAVLISSFSSFPPSFPIAFSPLLLVPSLQLSWIWMQCTRETNMSSAKWFVKLGGFGQLACSRTGHWGCRDSKCMAFGNAILTFLLQYWGSFFPPAPKSEWKT